MADPRPLSVLIIDDNAEYDFTTVTRVMHLIQISSLYDAQNRVIDLSRRSRAQRADIIISDVNMERWFHRIPERNSSLWRRENFFPVGPVLALPFISGSRVTALVPYSSYWPETADDGPALVSLSMIFSAIYGRPVNLTEAREMILDKKIPITPESAVGRGLEELRDRFVARVQTSQISVLNVPRLIRRLDDWLETESASGLPIRDHEGILGLEYIEAGESDCVQLSSLCADMLGFRSPKNAEPVIGILKWLETLVPYSRDDSAVLYEAAVDVLATVQTAEDAGQADAKLNIIIDAHPFAKDRETKYLLRRVVMLFSWVYAWHQEPNDPEKRVSSAYAALNLKGRDAVNKYMGLLSINRDMVPDRDILKYKHRHAFTLDHDGDALAAYQLKHDVPGNLDPLEIDLCIRYANEEFMWNPVGNSDDPPFPSWMRHE